MSRTGRKGAIITGSSQGTGTSLVAASVRPEVAAPITPP
jgi:hypothetical protein